MMQGGQGISLHSNGLALPEYSGGSTRRIDYISGSITGSDHVLLYFML